LRRLVGYADELVAERVQPSRWALTEALMVVYGEVAGVMIYRLAVSEPS
jgi:hypothetical protein